MIIFQVPRNPGVGYHLREKKAGTLMPWRWSIATSLRPRGVGVNEMDEQGFHAKRLRRQQILMLMVRGATYNAKVLRTCSPPFPGKEKKKRKESHTNECF
jgi:hypothetical protein